MAIVEDNEIGGPRAMPLRALDDVEIAKGSPDIRGWEAVDANGAPLGRVVELLADTDALRVSHAVVVDREGTRHQVPIESVQLQDDAKRAVVSDVAAMQAIPTHGDPRTDAVSAATGFRNEELIEKASEPLAPGQADVEVERVPVVDGAMRASDLAANEVRLPIVEAEALADREPPGAREK
ncbi:MAG TPA: hypothetical protein VFO55_07065 [Gemmatimonadaceae bacterium]|nr:hypothetical protein [Gemmatimonadaceae bacterium]